MNFTYYDLGHLNGSETVEVTLLGTEANVCLMDPSNFSNYKAGRQYRYYGGHATRSPVQIGVPGSGHWHVTIDLGGYVGQVKSNVSVNAG